MKTTILAAADGLSDQDLLARLSLLAGKEREALVELLAHLATLDTRPSVYAAEGYGAPRPSGCRKTRLVTVSKPPGPAGVSR